MSDLVGPAHLAQLPEQGGGSRFLPNLLDSSWFPHYELMFAPYLALRSKLRTI
jgi:hypothetical protein